LLIFNGDAYIKAESLMPMTVDDHIVDRFRSYVASVVARNTQMGSGRYLSKNNNNILRVSTIKKAFPRAIIIVPFRDPLQQSNSLLSQHQRFLAAHNTAAQFFHLRHVITSDIDLLQG
jgi:hypothetical protein